MSLNGRNNFRDLCEEIEHEPNRILQYEKSLNNVFDVDRYASLRDINSIKSPDFSPKEISSIFNEGATCLSVGCYNAAGTMFRLCLDLATRPLLPDSTDQTLTQPNNRQRRDLGLRLPWLFDQGKLPSALQPLADCIREDGNDGAHTGLLQKPDAEDLLDFTIAVLERLYTEPERLRLAQERRIARRDN